LERGDNSCTISFDIDKGKNKRTIRLGSQTLMIDGKQHNTGDVTHLVIRAMQNTLEIQADGQTITK